MLSILHIGQIRNMTLLISVPRAVVWRTTCASQWKYWTEQIAGTEVQSQCTHPARAERVLGSVPCECVRDVIFYVECSNCNSGFLIKRDLLIHPYLNVLNTQLNTVGEGEREERDLPRADAGNAAQKYHLPVVTYFLENPQKQQSTANLFQSSRKVITEFAKTELFPVINES